MQAISTRDFSVNIRFLLKKNKNKKTVILYTASLSRDEIWDVGKGPKLDIAPSRLRPGSSVGARQACLALAAG